MKIKSLLLKDFKRFSDLQIPEIPESAKLILLVGPNGSGKTSIFEAFKQWHGRYGATGYESNVNYLSKTSEPSFNNNWPEKIKVTFHQPMPSTQSERRKVFHIRSAYRNEADFEISQLNRVGSALDSPRISRLIDVDASVSDNYMRLVSHSIDKLYSGEYDSTTIKDLREMLLGEVRETMREIFSDLVLEGLKVAGKLNRL